MAKIVINFIIDILESNYIYKLISRLKITLNIKFILMGVK